MISEAGARELNRPFRVSVVMPLYAGADPTHLMRALASVFDQTLQPNGVIVVEDGPITAEHERVLASFEDAHPTFRRIRLPRNCGVAAAVQAGIEAARDPWIARMDSDDVSLPSRLEAQVEAVRTHQYDVVGGSMLEFETDDYTTVGVRRMPECHDEIVRLMRTNNAINHPTALFRRSLILAVGGYRPLAHLEDYDLWARVWAAGGILHNLPEPLVCYRAGTGMLARRRQSGIHRAELQLQRNLRSYGLVSKPRMVVNLVLRTGFRLLPIYLMKHAYRFLFHDRVGRNRRSLR